MEYDTPLYAGMRQEKKIKKSTTPLHVQNCMMKCYYGVSSQVFKGHIFDFQTFS